MRFLIIDTDYHAFLDWLYLQSPGLASEPYEKQMHARVDSFFACGGAYPSNLRKLGHEAMHVFFNNGRMQRAWARERGLKIAPSHRWKARLRRGYVPWLSRMDDERHLYEILTAQIKHYKPDVLINNAMQLSTRYFREIKTYCRLLIGSHGSPLPEDREFAAYDLVLSVVQNFVNYFRKQGLRSELLRLAFDPAVLERLDRSQRTVAVSFVGQLSSQHGSRQSWLTDLCERLPVQVWAPSVNGASDAPAVRRRYQGVAWGVEMYRVLSRSDVTLNHHIDVAGDYAGNSRLFEATGVGTLLVTDSKKNLHEMFDVGTEIAAYRTTQECAEIVEHYLSCPDERNAIAQAGQRRTLRDHTFETRAQELVDIVKRHV